MKKWIYCLMMLVLFINTIFMAAVNASAVTTNNGVRATGNFNIDLRVYDAPIISSGKVNLRVTLSADADTVHDDGELISVVIPREVYNAGTLTNINSTAFTIDHVDKSPASMPDSIIVYVKPVSSFNVGAAWSASFTISFQAPIIRTNTTLQADQKFTASYRGKTDTEIVPISMQPIGTPVPFEKWWKGTVDKNGIALVHASDSSFNTVHLAMNVQTHLNLHDVVVTDEVPQGLEIDPHAPVTKGIDATDSSSVDGIRIILTHPDGSREYVTAQYADKINYDPVTQQLTFSVDQLDPDEMLLVEYKVKVTHVYEQYKGPAKMTSQEVTKTASLTYRLDGDENFNKVLKKTVDETVITAKNPTIHYSLELGAITGTIKAGQTFTDKLDSRLDYSGIISDDSGAFDIVEQNNELTIVVKKDIPIGSSATAKFSVDATRLAIGDSVHNTGAILLNGEYYDSNTVTTKKIRGDILITKQDAADSTQKLADTVFELQNPNGDVVDTGVTNANGEWLIEGLVPGDYQLVETNASQGYALDSTPIPVTITNNSLSTLNITVENKKIAPSTLEVTKVDKDTGVFLADATFRLESPDGTFVEGKTDINGKLYFIGLLPGKYLLEETAAPINYLLDPTIHEVDVVSEGSNIQLTVENSAIPVIPPIFNDPIDPVEPNDPSNPDDPAKTPENSVTTPEKPVKTPNKPISPISQKAPSIVPISKSNISVKQEKIAQKANDSKLPKTGDHSSLVWVILGSLLLLACIRHRRISEK
ncbi:MULTISPECIES: MSCRAMM family protein [Listeriaceae]|nr:MULTISPECIES: SpaA isopeptide-forming pilin-related protein [Listeria]WAO22915.1 SpaA isopeptide-forming pilin-related protein [Listeria newyorkensis]